MCVTSCVIIVRQKIIAILRFFVTALSKYFSSFPAVWQWSVFRWKNSCPAPAMFPQWTTGFHHIPLWTTGFHHIPLWYSQKMSALLLCAGVSVHNVFLFCLWQGLYRWCRCQECRQVPFLLAGHRCLPLQQGHHYQQDQQHRFQPQLQPALLPDQAGCSFQPPLQSR